MSYSDKPEYFIKYCDSWSDFSGESRTNTDLYQAAHYYSELYYSEHPNIEDTDYLIEYVKISDMGVIKLDMIDSIEIWKEKLLRDQSKT